MAEPPALLQSVHLLHKSHGYSHDKLSCVVDKFSGYQNKFSAKVFRKVWFVGVINPVHCSVEIMCHKTQESIGVIGHHFLAGEMF